MTKKDKIKSNKKKQKVCSFKFKFTSKPDSNNKKPYNCRIFSYEFFKKKIKFRHRMRLNIYLKDFVSRHFKLNIGFPSVSQGENKNILIEPSFNDTQKFYRMKIDKYLYTFSDMKTKIPTNFEEIIGKQNELGQKTILQFIKENYITKPEQNKDYEDLKKQKFICQNCQSRINYSQYLWLYKGYEEEYLKEIEKNFDEKLKKSRRNINIQAENSLKERGFRRQK